MVLSGPFVESVLDLYEMSIALVMLVFLIPGLLILEFLRSLPGTSISTAS